MNFYISYFAQFKNMTKKQICFSTAIWDPKWFHDFKDQSYKFIKDGKICGLRCECFNSQNHDCKGQPCAHSPNSCTFLKEYEQQLLDLRFGRMLLALTSSAEMIAKSLSIDDPDIVLLVHEKPDNPCSERHAIMKLFNDNFVDMKEWTHDDNKN